MAEKVVSEPLVCVSTDERIIVMATPIWNEDRSEVRGLLGLSVDLLKDVAGNCRTNLG